MLHVPAWTMVDGRACYEFEQARKLLILDAELTAYYARDVKWAALTQELKDAQTQLQTALDAEKDISSQREQSNVRLNKMLLEATRRADKAEGKPGPYPAWMIGVGVGLGVGVISGILIGVAVAK
jgi:hypothetical protein